MTGITNERTDTEIFYTTKDLMKILHVGKNKANALMRDRSFPSTKLGRNYIIRKDLFDEFFDKQKNKNFEL